MSLFLFDGNGYRIKISIMVKKSQYFFNALTMIPENYSELPHLTLLLCMNSIRATFLGNKSPAITYILIKLFKVLVKL